MNKIYNIDCLVGIKDIPDFSVDLVIADPPYEFKSTSGGGQFGSFKYGNGRIYREEIESMSGGFLKDVLDECIRICKKPNMYIFCSKEQISMILSFASDKGLNYDIITWHKTNPVPACYNKYLSDTEYIIFLRGKGVRVYGSYSTKRKWYVTPVNKEDKKLYHHPTCKPVSIIQNLIVNSSVEGDVILDPFIGSGTTAVACMNTGRNFIGFELSEDYYNIANERIKKHINM